MNIFSPTLYKQASQSYSDAIKWASADDPKANSFAQTGLSTLAKANANAVQSRYILEEVLNARSKTIAAGASTSQASKFKEAEKSFLGLTTLIESGKVSKAKDGRTEVLKAYQQLELIALKGDTVEHAKMALASAKKSDVDDHAPKTLKLAEEEYQLALNVFDADRNNVDKAAVHANRSLWYSQRASQISETLRHFESSDYSEEDKVLWYQEQISRLAAPITNEVAYNLPNKEVIKGLNADIQGIINANAVLLGELEASSAGKQQLAREKEEVLMLSMQAQRENQAAASKFAFVQSLFTQNEAEVYRQTNDVLIRAYGFDFPSGKSEIESTNFALLNKITEAISTFPHAKILVSGHTDNVGGDQFNLSLSEARAEKVALFLNQVGNIPIERIEFKGYGKQRPVISNETAEGRAANRRVEILIINGTQSKT
ncbi:OmpA family protein [Alkalimarinus alittae]|uniref:OmpA family protein n=1 Tax=Alkalimarinus alittae TaxID=2961619 RepID=A0ABY6MZX7_9ALTE|nr:OmpA family protein [Alkalimarinus alittae]UZE95401.1 OmpA family protein [Alkalimarinus alittae]